MKLWDWFPNIFLYSTVFLLAILAADITVECAKNASACGLRYPRGFCGRQLRYAYNPETQKCVSFYYTGCSPGNPIGNSFLTFEECRRDCMVNALY